MYRNVEEKVKNMNKEYKGLMTNISLTAETLAEKAMEIHKEDKDVKSYASAKEMRERYMKLTDKLKDDKPLEKLDYAALIIAAQLVLESIENRIKIETKAVEQYKNNLIPKFKHMLDVEPEDFEAQAKVFFDPKT